MAKKRKATKKQRAALRKARAARKKGGRKRRKSPTKKRKTYRRRMYGKLKKRYGSAPGLMTAVDDALDLGIVVAQPLYRIAQWGENGDTNQLLNGLAQDYTGYVPIDDASPGGGIGESGTFDIKRAVGLKHLATALIRRKKRGFVKKYAPIRTLGKQSLASLATSGLAQGVSMIPDYQAVTAAQNTQTPGAKLIAYAEHQSRFNTGLTHDAVTGEYKGWDKDKLLQNVVAAAAGIGIKKGIGMITKNMKFKMPRV